MIYVYLGISLFIVLLFVILLRTFHFEPKAFPEMKKNHEFDQKFAIESLSKMIQFETISYPDPALENPKAFTDFRLFIKERFPHVFEKSTYSEHERAMLFHIKGEIAEDPYVFMSHYDVVPTNGVWDEEPFSGRINDQTVYGRGTLDTKSSLNAIMNAMEYLLSKGKVFKHDVYLAFGGDEEVYGKSAEAIVEYFKSHGIKPFMVLDEGGAIVKDQFPGVSEKAAVVGIAEKGFMNIKLVAKTKGGHASTPPKTTPITSLSMAVTKLNQSKAFKLKLTTPVKYLFESLAPHSKSFFIKMIFANLWLFLPIVKLIAKISGGEFLAMFKTTQAFTMSLGSEAMNVLPSEASIGINYRLMPGESSEMIVKKIKHIIRKYPIEVEVLEAHEASTISVIDDGYKSLTKAINQTWPEVIVSPYLMVATTDSRHYHAISERVFKFSPMDVSKDDLRKIHGVNEDITIDNIVAGVNFYINLFEQL